MRVNNLDKRIGERGAKICYLTQIRFFFSRISCKKSNYLILLYRQIVGEV